MIVISGRLDLLVSISIEGNENIVYVGLLKTKISIKNGTTNAAFDEWNADGCVRFGRMFILWYICRHSTCFYTVCMQPIMMARQFTTYRRYHGKKRTQSIQYVVENDVLNP